MTVDPEQAAAGALSPARGGWTISGHIRRLLRERPRMTRTELRAILRERMLLSWGTLGCQRFRAVLMQMAKAGEIALEGEDVIAVNLRERRPKAKAPETMGAKMRRMSEKRDARAKARQEAARAKSGA